VNNKGYPSFQDPFMRTVGDIRFNRATKHCSVFGIPEFTLWQYNDSEMTLLSHQQLVRRVEGPYKTNGDFCTMQSAIAPSLAVTDSYGNFSIYNIV